MSLLFKKYHLLLICFIWSPFIVAQVNGSSSSSTFNARSVYKNNTKIPSHMTMNNQTYEVTLFGFQTLLEENSKDVSPSTIQSLRSDLQKLEARKSKGQWISWGSALAGIAYATLSPVDTSCQSSSSTNAQGDCLFTKESDSKMTNALVGTAIAGIGFYIGYKYYPRQSDYLQLINKYNQMEPRLPIEFKVGSFTDQNTNGLSLTINY